MSLFEVGDNASFGKFAMRHCRIKTGVPGSPRGSPRGRSCWRPGGAEAPPDAAHGVGSRTVSLEGVTQPVA
jgi:hypothetical protein